mgnify:FL=1
MLPTKIVVIGAGSASFGLNTVAALLRSDRLRGSHIALVDRNSEALEPIANLAHHINREWDAQMTISQHTRHVDALYGARFVVSAIEVPPREALWRSDFELTLKHGLRQPYAENGGPGGFAHALRNIGPVLEIARDMEEACPDAWYINYTNPMVRICDAITRYTRIKTVGLCHQIYEGYGIIGYLLADRLGIEVPPGRISSDADPKYIPNMHAIIKQAVPRIEVRAAGLNHFTWVLDVHDRRTGEDLYPLLRERLRAAPPDFEPLTRRVFDVFGLMPVPGDQHLCEYLPWLSDQTAKPWEKYGINLYDWETLAAQREERRSEIVQMANGQMSIDGLRDADSEGALEVIECIAGSGEHYHLAVNLPNYGAILNLPAGAIVETPGVMSGAGVQAVTVGALPEAIAELCRRELAVVRLTVDAAVHGDRHAALQCLALDPLVHDLDMAQHILDDYLETYREYLPQFWQ